jgi:histidinol dehydrogenase
VAAVVAASPRRAEIESTLDLGGYVALVDGPDQAMAVANLIAPEHLELMNAEPEALVPLVRHAGAVFCGPWSPASVGDYLAGPNHVLPTHGSARFAGALRVDDFRKHVHVVTLDRAALVEVGPHVIALAEAEGLVTHAASVRMRLQR